MKTSSIQRNCGRGRNLTADLRPLTSGPRSGFSLLEVLMAVTVLIIIVVIISLVFQQANNAWGSGTRTAGAETTLRSIMGVIERDLVHAVDARQFGRVNSFGASTMTFVTLDGTNRMPQEVSYNYIYPNLKRSTFPLEAGLSATNWIRGGETTNSILNGEQALYPCIFDPIDAADPFDLPLRVEIEVHVVKDKNFAVVTGWSEGRNRPGHQADDRIVVSP